MANTVEFMTQREDGTWKTWKNIAVPVKYGKLLDEQLDYAVVSLIRIKRKEFKPMTRAKLTITSKTEYGGEQSTTMHYLIANDDSFETPIGKGEYNHELTLVELTKFLECFPLENLCFTNPMGNDYLASAPAPKRYTRLNEETTDETKIDGFPGEYRTPSAVGRTYNLLSSTDLTTTITVTIEYESGKVIEFSDDEIRYGHPQFTIEEGKNLIKYTIVWLGTVSGTYVEETHFTIEGSTANPPLKPWTLNDVIQRVLQLVEPIKSTSTPRFSFNLPEGDWRDYRKKYELLRTAPEFTFTGMTLREALQAVGSVIHAEPRLNENNEIVFDYYGEQEYATITNYKELANTPENGRYEPKRISKTKYRTLQNSFNIDQACTKLDSYQDNLVNRASWEGATIYEPYYSEGKTLRTEISGMRGEEDDTFYFPSAYGIDRVVSFQYGGYDLTAFIFEKKVYDNLSSYGGTYPYTKDYALYYTNGEKGIKGFFFKSPSDLGGTVDSNAAIVNILKSLGVQKLPEALTYGDMQFTLSYVPTYSTRVQQSKTYINDYLPAPRILNYSQTDNSVESRFFGENIKGAISRMGNPERTYTINLRNLNNIPKAGQLWDDDYYIASVSVAVNMDLFEVTVGLSKNFNRKSQYIGANSIKRIYEVSEEMVQQRHTVYNDYIVLTKSMYDIPNLSDGVFLDNKGFGLVFDALWRESTSHLDLAAGVLSTGVEKNTHALPTVFLPVITSTFGNAIEFTWEYKDNFSAGIKMEKKRSGTIVGHFSEEIPYGDYYGRMYYYNFELLRVRDAISLNMDPMILPACEGFVSSDNSIASSYFLLERKDSREALKKTYSIEFVTDEPTFVVGSTIASKNALVTFREENSQERPILVTFADRINKLSQMANIVYTEIGYANTPNTKYENNCKYIHFPGQKAVMEAKAWAYIIPRYLGPSKEVKDEDRNLITINEQLGGEIIVGENIDIKVGDTIGEFFGVAVHDIYKYLEEKRKLKE